MSTSSGTSDKDTDSAAAAAAAPVTTNEAQAIVSKIEARRTTIHPSGASGLRPLIWVSAVIFLVTLLLFLYR